MIVGRMSNPPADLPAPLNALKKIAGRYEIRGRLARGGMGEVFSVEDTASGKRVALKRLNERMADNPHIEQLFKLEYHTLSLLQHPHIIEVYDYGVDEDGPYYTMELLDGHDLHRLAPLPYALVCRYLRDVAASLALLHTRRVAHRDLSPKNVRVTSDGHCKLIDFGAMAHFGVTTDPAGTPPVVAPETVRGAPIDHRVDLYSLGALAYWLITGRHAYPAERIIQLPEAWRKPPRPIGGVVEDVPQRLENLIMSLLDFDPGARPPSVGYVIEELTTVAQLPPDDSIDDARAFVAMPTLVGRAREMDKLERALRSAMGGEGRALLIESNPGVGRSRLLSELAIRAQLEGALLSHVDAGRNREPHETARALVRGALRNVSDALRAEIEVSVLGHLLPELVPEGRPLSPLPDDPQQSAMALRLALLDCCTRLARQRPLVLLVDDVHRADDASLEFLAALVGEGAELQLMLVCTEELSAVLAAGGALDVLNARCRHVRLHRFDEAETTDLLRAMFGDPPNTAGLARWMHAVSLGNAGHNIELAYHLVEHGVLRYVDGRWLIPAQLPDMELPADLTQSMAVRVGQLSRPARALAEHLALLQGSAPLHLCVALCGSQEEAYELLDELTGLGIVIRSDDGYAFTRELLREVIADAVDPAERPRSHLMVADALLTGKDVELNDEIRAGLHLIRGGDEARGADMLVHRVERVASLLHDLPGAVEGLEAALVVYERLGRPLTECLRVRTKLVIWSAATGSPLTERHAERTLTLLYRYAGLRWAERFGPIFGRSLSLRLGALFRGIGRRLTIGRQSGLEVAEARSSFLRVLGALAAARLFGMDHDGSRQLAHLAQPLEGFASGSSGHAMALYCRGFNAYSSGRLTASRSILAELIEVLDNPRSDVVGGELPVRTLLVHARLVLGVILAREGSAEALRLADQLEGEGTPIGALAACEVRMVYHLMRGERMRVGELQLQFEQLATTRGTGFRLEAFNQVLFGIAGSMAGDLLAMKSSIGALDHLRRRDAHLGTFADTVRGMYLVASGRFREGITLLQTVADRLPAWSATIWPGVRVALASGLTNVGEIDRARGLLYEVEAQLEGEVSGLDVTRLAVQWLLGTGELTEGKQEAALDRFDALAKRLASGEGSPLARGRTHELAARAALACGDRPQYELHLKDAREQYGLSENPLLLAQAESLAHEVDERRPFSHPPDPNAQVMHTLAPPPRKRRQSRGELLGRAKTPHERAELCLSLVAKRADARAGAIFLVGDAGLSPVATLGAEQATPALASLVRGHVERMLEGHQHRGAVGLDDSEPPLSEDYTVHDLSHVDEGRLRVVGAVVLARGGRELRAPGIRVLENMARELEQVGDVLVGDEFIA